MWLARCCLEGHILRVVSQAIADEVAALAILVPYDFPTGRAISAIHYFIDTVDDFEERRIPHIEEHTLPWHCIGASVAVCIKCVAIVVVDVVVCLNRGAS